MKTEWWVTIFFFHLNSPSIKTPKPPIVQSSNCKKICNTAIVPSYISDDTVASLYNFFLLLYSLSLFHFLFFSHFVSLHVITLSLLPLSHLSRSRLATGATCAVLHGVNCGACRSWQGRFRWGFDFGWRSSGFRWGFDRVVLWWRRLSLPPMMGCLTSPPIMGFSTSPMMGSTSPITGFWVFFWSLWFFLLYF